MHLRLQHSFSINTLCRTRAYWMQLPCVCCTHGMCMLHARLKGMCVLHALAHTRTVREHVLWFCENTFYVASKQLPWCKLPWCCALTHAHTRARAHATRTRTRDAHAHTRQNAESGCFEIITSGGRARMQVSARQVA